MFNINWFASTSLVLLLLCSPVGAFAQEDAHSVPFSYNYPVTFGGYLPFLDGEQIAKVSDMDFVILRRTGENKYALERYDEKMQVVWSKEIKMDEVVMKQKSIGNTFVMYGPPFLIFNGKQVIVFFHDRKKKPIKCMATIFDAGNGSEVSSKVLGEPGYEVIFSPDKSKILMKYIGEFETRFFYLYDSSLSLIGKIENKFPKEIPKGCQTNFTKIACDNTGNIYQVRVFSKYSVGISAEQIVELHQLNVSDKTCRSFTNSFPKRTIKAVITAFDDKNRLHVAFHNHGQSFTDPLLDQSHLIKELVLVRPDFESETASEPIIVELGDAFSERISEARKTLDLSKRKRMERYSLEDLIIGPDGILVLTEYNAQSEANTGGSVSEELLVFGFDRNSGQPRWQAIVPKKQTAKNAEEHFSGISSRAEIINGELRILTLEEEYAGGRPDNKAPKLLLRKLNIKTGSVTPPAVLTTIETEEGKPYMRHLALWLTDNTLIFPCRKGKGDDNTFLTKLKVH